KSIGEYAFYFCIYLTSVTLPESVTSIGSNAFEMCIVLDSMIMKGETPPELGYDVFSDTSDDLQITVPSTAMDAYKTAWSDYADRIIMGMPYRWNCGADGDNCKATLTADGTLTISGTGAMEDYPIEYPGWNDDRDSVTNVVIENGVTSIGEYAFYKCSNLISITIPGSVTSIENAAFSLCSSLTDITIPDSVTSIGGYAFYDCSSLTDVTIPDGVTSIGGYAFYNCSSLTDVTIPDGVTSIGDFAFYYCSSLKSVLMKGETPPQLGISVLTNTHSNLRIHVPAPSGNTYKNAWSTYAGKIVEYLVLTEEACYPVDSKGVNKVHVGFTVNVPEDCSLVDYGLIYYNSGNVIHTEHLTLENVGVSGIKKASYYSANITDKGYGVTAVGFIKLRDETGAEETYYTGELGGSFEAMTNAAKYVKLTKQENKAITSGGKQKVYVGFDANVPNGYTVEDYGLIYYNSGNVIHTEHLTLNNVGVCGINKAKYWGANITDNGFGVTAVGFVKIKDGIGNETVIYSEELGGSFSAISEATAAKAVKLTRQKNKAVVSGGKNKVYAGFSANVPEDYTVEDYGLIYYNSGTVITTPYLTLENVGICGIQQAKYWGANITDIGCGVACVGFVKVRDANGYVTTLYTEELGNSFAAVSEADAANAV
ncbi:MAG: leucine-rich repeat domain-containing protein, partial [Oscillospiraceae bacterium]|nr:leucine-rich repeat domain-containing protein [Oscillospiraceae bacterium]